MLLFPEHVTTCLQKAGARRGPHPEQGICVTMCVQLGGSN